jgi:hypothetical protein
MHNTTVAINISLGTSDLGATVDGSQYLRYYQYVINDVVNQKNKIRYDQFYKMLKRLRLQPSELSMDLLVIACAAYAADTRVNRYATAQDSWTRRLKLFLPVSDTATWNMQKELLAQILEFLTGDIWTFEFRHRAPEAAVIAPRPSNRTTGLPYPTNTVCLFSGGLDSFISAYDLLSGGVRPLLVGHSKSKDVAEFRNIAYDSLRNRFVQTPPVLIKAHISIDKINKVTDREDTERGRSFLFLVLGIVTASCLPVSAGDVRKVIVPENGLISINLPLTPLRLGAYSTRTTHPTYLKMMRDLVAALHLDIEIVNPYEYKTKGEMLIETGDPVYVASVNTMSCSRPATRNANLEGAGERHCGRCVPCIIRRAALKKAGINDDNASLPPDRKYRFDILQEVVHASQTKGENVMAFKYLINKVHRIPGYLTTAIRMTGALEDAEKSLLMYRRGITEVEALLENVIIAD